ncbi:MAG TPA: nitroreductase family protein [Candidatus Binatia bacterium]|jgi:nitroreductase
MTDKPTSDVFEIMHTCRAMRRLKPDPVPEDVLVRLVDAAIHAPSSSNAQNWRFVIVRDRAQKQRIAELWQAGAAWYQETIGAAPPRPGEDPEQRKRSQAALQYMLDHIADVPAIVFLAVKKDEVIAKAVASPNTITAAFRHLGLGGTVRLLRGAGNATATGIYATAYPAAQNLLLAARALGLGAVLTTPQLFHPGQYEKLLGLPSDVTLAAVIPVGYPLGKFGPVKRPDPRSMISWDRYSA